MLSVLSTKFYRQTFDNSSYVLAINAILFFTGTFDGLATPAAATSSYHTCQPAVARKHLANLIAYITVINWILHTIQYKWSNSESQIK